MIYVFISQNIRLPSSTQFPIFKIIKHMKYTYSSKIIHTSSNSSLQLSFTTFWENIFSLKFHHTILRTNNRGISCMPLNSRILSHDWDQRNTDSRVWNHTELVEWRRKITTKHYKTLFKSTGAIIVSGSIDDEKFKTKKLWRNNYKTLLKSTGAIYQTGHKSSLLPSCVTR